VVREPTGPALPGHTSPFTIVIRHPGTPRICALGEPGRKVAARTTIPSATGQRRMTRDELAALVTTGT